MVEILDEIAAPATQESTETAPEEPESMQAESEKPPDAVDLARSSDAESLANTPALDAVSLGAIEAALNGHAGDGSFGDAMSFASGGRIGGTGQAGVLEEPLESAFSLADIDQKPTVIYQSAPLYPSELRSQKLEGTVSVIFVVDAQGKTVDPRVEKSTNPAFDKPALDAVRQWKFEPAVKAGQRVSCKMRVPIRFQPR
ncbi:MAG: energy transducer TonB [Planctomycetes bacterium]|nr:energy transducer TonB [Planctomycetota bacterium]